MACVIAVTGLQPQAGKTTVAVNLAAALAMDGYSCLLLDLAVVPDASRLLGVKLTSSALAASAVLEGCISLLSARVPTAAGIDLVAGYPDTARVAASPASAGIVLGQQLTAVHDEYNFVVLDSASWFGPLEAMTLKLAEGILVTTCPGQLPASFPRLPLAYAAGTTQVVANKVLPGWDLTAIGREAEEPGGERPNYAIRYAPELTSAYWRGLPPVQWQPNSSFAQDLRMVAQGVAAGHSQRPQARR
jgi:MinD-like ATPase involved in chromosome partitioning or flagellar assembly